MVRDTAQKMLIENISAADDVWVVSRGAGENLRGMGFKGRYTVMENGVDFPRGGVPAEEARKIDALHGIPENVPVYLFVGRMMWYKGIRLIMDALQTVREKGHDFRMIFIGDGAEKEEMIRYGEEKGLADRLVFAGAVRYQRDRRQRSGSLRARQRSREGKLCGGRHRGRGDRASGGGRRRFRCGDHNAVRRRP